MNSKKIGPRRDRDLKKRARQCWIHAFKEFSRFHKTGKTDLFDVGICAAIVDVAPNKSVRLLMQEQFNVARFLDPEPKPVGFWWPRDRDGAKRRADWIKRHILKNRILK